MTNKSHFWCDAGCGAVQTWRALSGFKKAGVLNFMLGTRDLQHEGTGLPFTVSQREGVVDNAGDFRRRADKMRWPARWPNAPDLIAACTMFSVQPKAKVSRQLRNVARQAPVAGAKVRGQVGCN